MRPNHIHKRHQFIGAAFLLHQMLTGIDPSLTPFQFTPLQLPNYPALARLETNTSRVPGVIIKYAYTMQQKENLSSHTLIMPM
jgi:hypothetical protein